MTTRAEDRDHWEIEVAGEGHALQLLREALDTDGLRLRLKDGRYLLRATELDDITVFSVAKTRAEELIASLSGAARLILGWTAPLELKEMARRHADGTLHRTIQIESARVDIRCMPVTLSVTRADGTREARLPGEPAVRWLREGSQEGARRRVLRLISEPDLGWVELYRIYEVVLGAAGSRVFDLVPRARVELFKRTANSVGAVGDLARHGRERQSPPGDPIKLPEAQALILELVRLWLDREDTVDSAF